MKCVLCCLDHYNVCTHTNIVVTMQQLHLQFLLRPTKPPLGVHLAKQLTRECGSSELPITTERDTLESKTIKNRTSAFVVLEMENEWPEDEDDGRLGQRKRVVEGSSEDGGVA